MSPTAQILLAAAGTYLFRVSFIAFAGAMGEIPPRVETALSMIPPAVLAAITVDSLVFTDDGVRSLDAWYLALAIAAVVTWRTKSVALCLVVGMSALWVLGAIG